MKVEITNNLDSTQRARLAELSNVLISGGLGLPAASDAKVHEKWIDRALGARPDLFQTVADVVAMVGDPKVILAKLEINDPDTFGNFSFIVAGAYLMNPAVCKELGLPGNAPKPNPALPDESDMYLEDGLLDQVIARGPIYRPTPGASAR